MGSRIDDSVQHCVFRDAEQDLLARGLSAVGLSSKPMREQQMEKLNNRVAHRLVSDPELLLAETLGLPTFDLDGKGWYRRLMLVVSDGYIKKVFFPVPSTERSAAQVLTWTQATGFRCHTDWKLTLNPDTLVSPDRAERGNRDMTKPHAKEESVVVAEPAWSIPSLREPRYSQSLERGLAILKCFTPKYPLLGIADIADELGMSRSTTHRYVITLLALGYLEQSASRKYRLGLGPTNLGTAALNSTGLRDAAWPYLDELRSSTGFSVGMGVLDGADVVYVDHLRNLRRGQTGRGPNVRLGVRVPARCTSMGKLLLAFLSEEDLEAALAESGRAQRTKHALTKSKLREHLKKIPMSGYAISDEEFYPGARSLAVPVRNESSEVVAAVNLSIYDAVLSVAELVEFYPMVGATAEQVSRALGYEPGDNGGRHEWWIFCAPFAADHGSYQLEQACTSDQTAENAY
jgi:IclR family pca regulon transcriptional regulator